MACLLLTLICIVASALIIEMEYLKAPLSIIIQALTMAILLMQTITLLYYSEDKTMAWMFGVEWTLKSFKYMLLLVSLAW